MIKFLVLFFLASVALVHTNAVLILSIYRRFALLDIFAFCEIYSQNGKFDMFSLRSNSI